MILQNIKKENMKNTYNHKRVQKISAQYENWFLVMATDDDGGAWTNKNIKLNLNGTVLKTIAENEEINIK